MTARRGTSNIVVAALAIAVVALASSTIYLGFSIPRTTTGTNLGGSNNDQVVVKVPAYSGTNGATGSSQTTGIDPPTDTITVTGTGTVSYTPNEALVGLSIITTNKTAQVASQANAAITSRVIKALNGIGIANSSLQTQGFSLYANYYNYNYPNYSPPAIMSYTVTNSISVNLTANDPSILGLRVGAAIDTAVGAGANQVNLQFTGTMALQAQVNTEALKQAVATASVAARTIAGSLGVNITGVVSVTQGYSYSPSYYPYYGASYALSTTTYAASTPIIPGTQTGSANVVIVYSIG